MPMIFLSLRGDDAARALESFRRALGEEATSLAVVPTNDETGYHGSAEVSDVAAAREAFTLARKPFPTLRAYLGEGGREEPPRATDRAAREPRRTNPANQSTRPANRGPEGRSRPTEAEGSAQSPEKPEGPGGGQRRGQSRGRNRQGRRSSTNEQRGQTDPPSQ